MTDHDKTHNAARLLEQLQRNQAFRGSETGGLERELSLLRRWQSARLARTYADLRQNARYRLATEFFLHELYGDGDLGQREQDLARIVPMMTHILPGNVLYTTALALELNALSRELDARLTRILVAEFDFRDSLDEATYVAAYRQCARYQQRSDQIELVEQLGRDLQSIVPRRFIHTALKLAKTPARLAGLVELHRFLSAGFEAFRCMGADAETFITTITRRERAILERIRSGHSQPLEWNGVSAYPGSTC
ncbi:MAG: hypothetical protein IPL59_06800 [Candidatus Competibacteraceae bacterium]|nr:hypothetical protein [Candidatus Competibacteraceae bacterium]